MIIICSQCTKRYNVDPGRIPIGMTSIKCKACGYPISLESLSSQSTLVDKVCSKCGYQRQAEDELSVPVTECPKCGIIYEKYKNLPDIKKVTEKQKPSSELKQLEEKTEAKGKEKSGNLEKEKKSNLLIYINKSRLILIFIIFLCLLVGYYIGKEHLKYKPEEVVIVNAKKTSPEQKQQIADLKQELLIVRQNINEAKKTDAIYSGGLIKSLIAVRLEILKINESLVEQRINALESGARITVVLNESEANPEKALEIKREIEAQKAKLAEAQAESDRYSGGLVKSLADTSVATVRNTITMLEQQYLVAQYGIVIPTLEIPKTTQTNTVLAAQTTDGAKECLKIETLDSSVLSTNNVFTELAWKVDVSNSCDKPFMVRIKFTIYDKDDFELDSDSKDVYVTPHELGKARGKMLVSPPEKASRMVKHSASILTL